MQKSSTPILLALVAIALVGAMFYYAFEANKPKFDWEESSWEKKGYDEKNDQPYGSLIAHNLLAHYFEGEKFVELRKNIAKELPVDRNSIGHNYVFIGEAMYLDSAGTKRLLDFVAAGNTAFISSKTIPFDLMTFVYFDECAEANWNDYGMVEDSLGRFSLRTPILPDSSTTFFFARQNIPENYPWNYIGSYYFCDSLKQHPLGYLNKNYINFAEFPLGKGRFLLHTNPIAFSNFSLLRHDTHPYVAGVFSQLSEGNIYWDAVSRVPEEVGRRNNGLSNRSPAKQHLLTFILEQPALAWAWYIITALAIIWLVFRAKRRQRIIPVLPKNENSSYEFISTIANLHFQEKNYSGLSKQGMRHFLAHLRERYGLVVLLDAETGLPRTDDDFFQKISLRTQVQEIEIRRIFSLHANTLKYQPNEAMAMDLHRAMEAFLRTAK